VVLKKAIMAKYIVNPILLRMKESARGSIYQSIVALGMRSRQINDQIKSEFVIRAKDYLNNLEESDDAQKELFEISKDFDVIPKPNFIAMKELMNERLRFTLIEPDQPVEPED
jgi:DNA-directed RNA polymerase subunit K/omega